MARKFLVSILLFCFIITVSGRPPSDKTVGQPWPMPMMYKPSPDAQPVSSMFQFNVVGNDCDILESALERYYIIIFGSPENRDTTLRYNAVTSLGGLDVNVAETCEQYPSLEMDESYKLTVDSGKASLSSKTIWGALRGLETFSQIIYDEEGMINNSIIEDSPRFSHRGVLLDTSRHFLPKEVILQNLDAMAYNKLNVFHWHIVDDQSFPYESVMFPELSRKGAYNPYTHVYSQADIHEIIEYARMRGIRVVPEFDSPGHSLSWGQGQANLLTKCYKGTEPNGEYGPIDPTMNTTYTFLKQFMKELTTVFPDKYIHLGGDEVSFACWQSNPAIATFMEKMGFAKDYAKLEEYYMQQLLNIVGGYGSEYIIWQEVIDNGVKVQPNTVVEVWKGGYEEELDKVTKLGLRTMLSSCWYLNKISYAADWHKYYTCDPQSFNGTQEQKKLVMGGELCMWGEYVDATNVLSRTWPRGSAVAERLWSPQTLRDTTKATPRLEEHRCRLIRRGLQVEPVNGPGFCKYEYKQKN